MNSNLEKSWWDRVARKTLAIAARRDPAAAEGASSDPPDSRAGGRSPMIPAVAAPAPSPEWRAFRHRLEQYVRRRVSNPADAEDLVQDILSRAVDRLPSLKSSERLTPWLHTISRHALVDFYRRRSRSRDVVPLEAAADPEAPSLGEGDRRRDALAACIRPMVACLPPLYREAVTRVDLNGERQVDVARELGLGISALKSRVQRGRAMLQQVFSECCHFERDAAGRVIDYHKKGDTCLLDEPKVLPIGRREERLRKR